MAALSSLAARRAKSPSLWWFAQVEQICDAATALLARIDNGGKTTLVVTAGAKGAVVARGAAAGGGAPELVPTVALSKVR